MDLTFHRRVLVLFCVWLATLAARAQAQATEGQHERQVNNAGALKQYEAIKEGLRQNKHEMCSFLLADIDNQNEVLDLAKVTYLFETALDHLAKSSEYVTLIRPYVDQQVVRSFDEQGGNYVLEISEARRRVIEDYGRAVELGASDLKKRNLLEEYFYKACEFKLATIVAEKAMYESALKAEKSLRVKLLSNEQQQQQQQQQRQQQ